MTTTIFVHHTTDTVGCFWGYILQLFDTEKFHVLAVPTNSTQDARRTAFLASKGLDGVTTTRFLVVSDHTTRTRSVIHGKELDDWLAVVVNRLEIQPNRDDHMRKIRENMDCILGRNLMYVADLCTSSGVASTATGTQKTDAPVRPTPPPTINHQPAMDMEDDVQQQDMHVVPDRSSRGNIRRGNVNVNEVMQQFNARETDGRSLL